MTRYALLTATIATAICGVSGISFAQSAPDDARARYTQEREKCLTHNTQDTLASCLHEAGAALGASRNGQLSQPGPSAAANTTDRCNTFQSAAEQAECVQRIQGPNTTTSGSVSGGGILRESVTTTVTPP